MRAIGMRRPRLAGKPGNGVTCAHREVVLPDFPADVGDRGLILSAVHVHRRKVRVRLVPAGEDFVTVARRVEEVDGVAPAETVDVRPESDGHVVHRHDRAGVTDRAPVLQLVRPVVQPAVLAFDEGDVVGLVLAEHPGAYQLGVVAEVAEQPLRRLEVQRLHEEPLGQSQVLRFEQAVVEPGTPMPTRCLGEQFRVE